MTTNRINYIDPSSVINTQIFETIRDIATCVFCTGIVINAKQCNKCENCFCKDCIAKWKEKSNDCPFKCGEIVIGEPSRVVKNILNRITFKCPKHCRKEINYEELVQHVEECTNKVITCPTCSSRVPKDKVDKYSYFELKIENEILRAKLSHVEVKLLQVFKESNTHSKENKIVSKTINNVFDGLLYREDHDEYDPNAAKKILLNNEVNEMINIDKLIIPGEEYGIGSHVKLDKDSSSSSCKLFPDENSSNKNFSIHDNNVRFSYKFSCCGKYYDCIPCHNSSESHPNSKIVSIACYECLAMTNHIDESDCDNCGNSFIKEKLSVNDENSSVGENVSNGAKAVVNENMRYPLKNPINNNTKNKPVQYGKNEWDKIKREDDGSVTYVNYCIDDDVKRSKKTADKNTQSFYSKSRRANGDRDNFKDI